MTVQEKLISVGFHQTGPHHYETIFDEELHLLVEDDKIHLYRENRNIIRSFPIEEMNENFIPLVLQYG